jgi:hypothetical protein
MSMKSRSGYPDSSMEVCIRDSSTHPTSKIQTQQVPLSSKLPPSPQEATSHDSTSTPRKTAWRTVDRKAQSNRLTATPSAPIPKAGSHLLHVPVPPRVPSALLQKHSASWATWKSTGPSPSPPHAEPNVDVQRSGSPGLFGPLSPRNSVHGP